MCIVLISTAHPSYPLILINNRDEFLSRATAPLAFWDAPHMHVLGGRDLMRHERGTWLGVTQDGRIAVLTNYRDDNAATSMGPVSRGAMVNAWLTPTTATDTQRFARQLVTGEGARGAGGFSLVCGQIGRDLAVVSNRMTGSDDIKWIAHCGETVALSNAAYGDRSWPKVEAGETRLSELIGAAVRHGWTRDDLIQRLFALLSIDSMPERHADESFEQHLRGLRHTILVPPLEKLAAAVSPESKNSENAPVQSAQVLEDVYATQKQSVVLVDRAGLVTYVEKSLFDGLNRREVPEVRRFEIQLPYDIRHE